MDAIEREHFDLIHAETFYVMPNIPNGNIPIILVEQTIEYLVYKHYTENVKFFLLKWIMNFDVAKIYFWEKQSWKRARRVVAMSEADKQTMRQVVPNLDVHLVPNGVDTEFFTTRKKNMKSAAKTVLFVGNFKWLQNREAVTILIRDIWPKIKSGFRDVRLWVVGRFPTDDIKQMASKDITISSDVDDIREAYGAADVLLAPIYGPGGTRYKVLESMAAGLPVVTTSTGIEGLGAVDGKDAIISDNVEGLAERTIEVLSNARLHDSLAVNGRKLVEKKFNWKAIASGLDSIYNEAAYGA